MEEGFSANDNTSPESEEAVRSLVENTVQEVTLQESFEKERHAIVGILDSLEQEIGKSSFVSAHALLARAQAGLSRLTELRSTSKDAFVIDESLKALHDRYKSLEENLRNLEVQA